MKLRNKKTGAINKSIVVSTFDGLKECYYNSLAELNEEWEDYEPKEPLIKDEKIRRAIRAWAEANRIDELVYYRSSHYWYLRASNDHDQSIDFWLSYDRKPELIENKRYNIDELCGEDKDEA